MKNKIIFILILCLFVLIYQVKLNFQINNNINKIVENNITKMNCSNLSLSDFAYCMVNFIKPNYNYTQRNLSFFYFSDVIENGGDCSEWTQVYKFLSEDNGFIHKSIQLPTHVFSVITNKNNTGYCIIDGLDINCWELE